MYLRDSDNMGVNNLTGLIGKDVYTKNAKFIGKVDDTMLDSERGAVYGIVIQMARDSFLFKMFEEGGESKKAILIPHRHIIAAEDILIVAMPEKYESAQPIGAQAEPAPEAPVAEEPAPEAGKI